VQLLTTSGNGRFVLYGGRSTGTAGETEAVTLRSDDGRTWEEFDSGLPDDTFVDAVERGPNGFLLAGGQANGNPSLWLSSDGFSWDQVHEFEPTGGFVQIDDADGGEEGYVVLGRRHAPTGTSYQRFAFASADGLEWLTSEEPFGSDNQEFVFATNVTSFGPDWVATLGHPDGPSTAVWHSENGLEWTEVGEIRSDPNTSAGVLETTGIGLFHAPSSPARFEGFPGLWSSPDVGEWTEENLGATAVVNDLAESPGNVAVIGSVPGDEFNATLGIWIRSTE
jgi:hypothetical protein